jgi:hypothetical protein
MPEHVVVVWKRGGSVTALNTLLVDSSILITLRWFCIVSVQIVVAENLEGDKVVVFLPAKPSSLANIINQDCCENLLHCTIKKTF